MKKDQVVVVVVVVIVIVVVVVVDTEFVVQSKRKYAVLFVNDDAVRPRTKGEHIVVRLAPVRETLPNLLESGPRMRAWHALLCTAASPYCSLLVG